MSEKKIVIFGAGNKGRFVLQENHDNVAYFVDNDKAIQGRTIHGIPVKSVEEYISDKDKYDLIIAGNSYKYMERQIKELGVENYTLFLKGEYGYYMSEDLIFNPYENSQKWGVNEEKFNENVSGSSIIEDVNKEVEELHGKNILFRHVEIETVNRCNGGCAFCPVSVKNDTREYRKMTRELFEKIINELSKIEYAGRLALFSNNEPFLDEDIIEKHRYAREKVPHARMHLFTNGTLLTIDKFSEIIKYLDELIIDNYNQDLKLIPSCQRIVEYCEEHPELKKKVTIVLRKPDDILNNVGGTSPNRKDVKKYSKDRCILPYKQLIIRPDGKVSLCCCDGLGKNTLGDASVDSLVDIWNNDKFRTVRECLYQGRENWKSCENCDFFSLG